MKKITCYKVGNSIYDDRNEAIAHELGAKLGSIVDGIIIGTQRVPTVGLFKWLRDHRCVVKNLFESYDELAGPGHND